MLSKTMRSGSAEHPTPHSLVKHVLAELVGSRWNWVTLETKPMKHFVELAQEGDQIIINVAYGFSEDYKTLFARHGVMIPDRWRVTEFRKKSGLSGGSLLLATGIDDQDRIAEFVDRLFPALFGEGPSYELTGVFQ